MKRRYPFGALVIILVSGVNWGSGSRDGKSEVISRDITRALD
jgi:hypothetical protein